MWILIVGKIKMLNVMEMLQVGALIILPRMLVKSAQLKLNVVEIAQLLNGNTK